MQMDYGNSHRKKEGQGKAEKADKQVAKVISGEVIVKKKPFIRKVKDTFVAADFGSVGRYLIGDVLIPAVKNMLVDAGKQGIDRVIWGDRAVQRQRYGPGPRITYQTPISRPYTGSPNQRNAPPIQIGPRVSSRSSRDDIILSSREEAQNVLERLGDVIDTFEFATVADLKDLLGLEATHVDNKWGWVYVGDAAVRQVREGFLLDLPPENPID